MSKLVGFLTVFIALLLVACGEDEVPGTGSEGAITAGGLTEAWVASGLENPESVVYDPTSGLLFVSNVNGDSNEKDGNGYISKLDVDGTIISKKWFVGLHAPKGLAIYQDTLYVADIDTLVAIDIPSATLSGSYQVSDAKFLNDVAATEQGDIFVSDMLLDRIHRLHGGQFELWLESPQLEGPNGLYVEGDKLILGAWGVMTDGFATDKPGHLKSISLLDKSISSLGGGTPIGNLDGVERITPEHYYVTDWMVGKLFKIDNNGKVELLLQLEQGMADLEILDEQQLVLLPMMLSNKLLAYKIK